MRTKTEILDFAIDVLRSGESFSQDAVAKKAGLTKPGLIHHFPTKEALTLAVVDRIIDRWLDALQQYADGRTDSAGRVRAYVEYALSGTFDLSDLALLADVRLREKLCQLWTQRMDPWFGIDAEGSLEQRAVLRAVRLLADGAWFNESIGIPTMMTKEERIAVRALAFQLLDEGYRS
jgi:AcrR family transcriptional regulator